MSKQDDTRWVSKRYEQITLDYTRIEEAIERLLEALAAQQRGEWKGLHLEIDEEYGSHSIILSGQRPETATERAERERHEQGQLSYRRQMYETLKKEFEEKK